MMPEYIDTDADVMVTIVAPVKKLCPIVHEVDEGTVTLTYRTSEAGGAMELHSIADYLAGFATVPMTHEDFTEEVHETTGFHVTSTWTTAGMAVTVAVPEVVKT